MRKPRRTEKGEEPKGNVEEEREENGLGKEKKVGQKDPALLPGSGKKNTEPHRTCRDEEKEGKG